MEYCDISRIFHRRFPNIKLPRIARFTTALAKKNSNDQVQRFPKGDSCPVGGTGKYAGELFYLIIDRFILVSIQGNYEVFVDGSYLVSLYNDCVLMRNPWAETVVLRERPYQQERLQWS